MRVRSSSAPTVRRRLNQRALSMASAASSTKPARNSMSQGVNGSWCSRSTEMTPAMDPRVRSGA
jgi:hypothetical protein